MHYDAASDGAVTWTDSSGRVQTPLTDPACFLAVSISGLVGGSRRGAAGPTDVEPHFKTSVNPIWAMKGPFAPGKSSKSHSRMTAWAPLRLLFLTLEQRLKALRLVPVTDSRNVYRVFDHQSNMKPFS